MKHFIFTTLLLLSSYGFSQSVVYGVDPQSSDLVSIDTVTFASTTITLTSTTGTIQGCNGLATDPCGLNYIVYRVAGTRYLGTINFASGVITEIGSLADNISSIAYDYTTSTLYGVTGDGANTPETLYEINTTTAAMVFAATLGNGDDGETITFNPTDGLLYHWSGWGVGNAIMETIDPANYAITPVTYSGDLIENVGAAVYVGGRFLVSDINLFEMHWVTTAGVVTNTNAAFGLKGLSFGSQGISSVTVSSTPGTVVCSGDTVVITPSVVNPNYTYNWLDGAGVSTGVTTNTFSTDTAGTFICEVTSPCGVVASSPIVITAGLNPVFTLQLGGSPFICPGDSVSIFGGPSGGTNQWFYNGNLITGATNASYFGSAPGFYALLHTNAAGCSDSANYYLGNSPVPTVTLASPAGLEFCPGDSIELTVNTNGDFIQWFLNNTAISGATGNTHYATAAGSYNVTAINSIGCNDSAAAPLQVTEASVPNVILTPSTVANFCAPGTVDISVNAGGGSRQWYRNGVMIPGANGNFYTVADPGVYNVVKTNMSGCSDSAAVGTTAIDTCGLGLADAKADLIFKMFPNPATNQVTLDFSAETLSAINQVSIISIDGKSVAVYDREAILATNLVIGLDNIAKGLYFVKVSAKGRESVKELIVH